MKRFWIFIAIAGVAILAMSAYQYMSRPGRGDPAPRFYLPSISGERVSLESFKGQPVILHFWATWCGVCREEFPSLARMARDFSQDGIVVIGVSEDDGASAGAAVQAFLKQIPAQFPILLDRDGRVANEYQSWGVPETVFIDRGGVIVKRSAGAIAWDNPEVRANIRTLVR